ncbi:hypothetical protein [Formosa sp. PL04]|uniref:hypothetical protein n=1 Tax=Formosa sp. PL04 TaxID=3081755 RepID=UPI002981BCA2|nr:hypothetical protein [Formosa sp. PL04]MDW5287899.1 hypothetical protein [Formosa sp. PL04]
MEKENKNTEITRKEAIKKMGKYAAFTAIGTFAVLNPLQAQNTSQPIKPSAGGEETIDTPAQINAVTPTDTQVGKTQVESNF